MTRLVILDPHAEHDLIQLFRYIARERGNPYIAQNYIRGIRAYLETLGDLPERGRRRDDLAPNLRVVTYKQRILIAYLVQPSDVSILRIIAGGRDLGSLTFKSR